MKSTLSRDALVQAITIVERVTNRNASLPILSNILLETIPEGIRLSATNLEIGVTSVVRGSIEGEARLAIPGRVFGDFLRAANSDQVSLHIQKLSLSIQAGSYRTSILCSDAAEYPLIPKIAQGTEVHMAAPALARVFYGVTDSSATSDARPELAGVYVQLSPELLTVAATDSFRLVERRIACESPTSYSIIVPRTAILELLRVMHDSTGDVVMRIADNQIVFLGDHFELVSRLIDGTYPDYHKVIPERALSRTLVRSKDLEDAVKAAALFTSTVSDIHFFGDERAVRVQASNTTKGEATVEIEANTKGESFDVSMNYHYLLDGLKAIGEEKVVLEFTGKGSPFVIRQMDGAEVVYIIMPLRG